MRCRQIKQHLPVFYNQSPRRGCQELIKRACEQFERHELGRGRACRHPADRDTSSDSQTQGRAGRSDGCRTGDCNCIGAGRSSSRLRRSRRRRSTATATTGERSQNKGYGHTRKKHGFKDDAPFLKFLQEQCQQHQRRERHENECRRPTHGNPEHRRCCGSCRRRNG